MKLDYATGFYNMSFFNINIETEEELTQDVLKKNEATFIHEFIHYLQDLVLPYNIRYSLSNVRWFFNILDSAHKIGSIHRLFSEWDNESSVLWTQFIRSIGDSRNIDSVFKIEDATSQFVITSGYDGNLHIHREHRVYEAAGDQSRGRGGENLISPLTGRKRLPIIIMPGNSTKG